MEWLKPLISSLSEGFEREEELTELLLNHTAWKTAGSLGGNLQTDKGCWGRTHGHTSKAEWFCLTVRLDEKKKYPTDIQKENSTIQGKAYDSRIGKTMISSEALLSECGGQTRLRQQRNTCKSLLLLWSGIEWLISKSSQILCCFTATCAQKVISGAWKVGAWGTHFTEKPGKPKLLLLTYGRWPSKTHFCKGIKDEKQVPRIHVRDVKERSSAADYSDWRKLKSKLIHKARTQPRSVSQDELY